MTQSIPEPGARVGADPDRAAEDVGPLLSVLVPVYNEQDTVEELLARVEAVPIDKEIIVVDDGSTDGTREILVRMAENEDRITLVLLEKNSGKGAALHKAIERAKGRISIVQDADLELDPQDYPALIQPILDGNARVVYGSRTRHPDNRFPLDLFRIGSYATTLLTNVLYLCWLSDESTGYKVIETELLKSIPLRCKGFDFCPEVTAKVRKRGERIVEVPIRYERRTVKEGKKIKWRDGLIGLWTLFKYRFVD